RRKFHNLDIPNARLTLKVMKVFIALCSFCLFYAAEAKAANFHADSRIERPAQAGQFAPPQIHLISTPLFSLAAPEIDIAAKPLRLRFISIKKILRFTGLSPPANS